MNGLVVMIYSPFSSYSSPFSCKLIGWLIIFKCIIKSEKLNKNFENEITSEICLFYLFYKKKMNDIYTGLIPLKLNYLFYNNEEFDQKQS
jgi:hypothetical protein